MAASPLRGRNHHGQTISKVYNSLPALGQGIIGLLSSTFSSATAFLIGAYFSVFILFFILRNGPGIDAWLARQFNLKP